MHDTRPDRAPRPRRRLQALAACVAVLLAASGCAGGAYGAALAGPAVSEPGVLKIAMTSSNIPLTGTYPDNGYEGFRFVANNLYDALTRLNLDQEEEVPTPQPALAESWEHDESLTTWTFHLRDGVTFHDGTPFDADAVIFAIDRIKDPESEWYDPTTAPRSAAVTKYFASWRKVDDLTVEITTTQPYAYLPWDTTALFIGSPTAIRKWGNELYPQHATGTGAFRMTRLVDGQVLEMVRNDDYWRGPAKLERIELYPAPEAATRLSMLQSGQVNFADAPSPDAIGLLEEEGYEVKLAEYPHGIMPRFNLFRAPFKDDLGLRRALNMAIDREGTAALVNGSGFPAHQYVYEGHPHYVPDNPGHDYDPDEARRLIAEAGYAPGELKLTMAYPTGGSGNMYPDLMMQKLQMDFRAVGVELSLLPLEWNTIITIGIEGLNTPQWEHIDILWASPAAGMMPTGYTTTFFCFRGPEVPNATGLCDERVDAAMNAAMASPDPEDQYASTREAMDVVLDEAYFLFWIHDLNLRVLAPDVHGYQDVQSWWLDFTRYSVGGEK